MADLSEIVGEAEDSDDVLSDLSMVIVNVEAKDGRQMSMVLDAEGMQMSLTTDLDGDTMSEVHTFTVVRRIRL